MEVHSNESLMLMPLVLGDTKLLAKLILKKISHYANEVVINWDIVKIRPDIYRDFN